MAEAKALKEADETAEADFNAGTLSIHIIYMKYILLTYLLLFGNFIGK